MIANIYIFQFFYFQSIDYVYSKGALLKHYDNVKDIFDNIIKITDNKNVDETYAGGKQIMYV